MFNLLFDRYSFHAKEGNKMLCLKTFQVGLNGIYLVSIIIQNAFIYFFFNLFKSSKNIVKKTQ